MSKPWWRRPHSVRLKRALCRAVNWRELFADTLQWKEGQNLPCTKRGAHQSGTDNKPSMGVVPNTHGAVKCFTCGYATTSFIGTLEDVLGIEYEKLCRQLYSQHVEPIVPEKVLKALAKNLRDDEELVTRVKLALKVGSEELDKWQLGWSAAMKRLTVPVLNEFGYCVDVRCYDIFGLRADNAPKVKSLRHGYGKVRVFPHTKERVVVIVEGEKDTIAARGIGLPAQTFTGGGESHPPSEVMKRQFEGKTVYVVGDNDKTGIEGAKKRCKKLAEVGATPVLVSLPVKEAKEDMWDWVHKYGGTADKFWELVKDSKPAEGDWGKAATMGDAMEAVKDLFTKDGPKSVVDKSKALLDAMKAIGWFYRVDCHVYYATNDACMIVDKKNSEFRAFMTSMNPWLNKETPVGRFILEHVENSVKALATEANVSNQFYYAVGLNRLYVKTSKEEQSILEISNEAKRLVRNGDNDAKILLVMADHSLHNIEEVGQVDPVEAVRWLWDNVFKFMPTPDYQRAMILLWYLAGIFKQATPDRPILRLMAPSTHGKSHVLRMLSCLTYGGEYVDGPGTTIASLATNAGKRPVLFIDNIEMEHVIQKEGLNDLFISLATNVAKEKRKIGTDTDVIYEKCECVTATTGIEPFEKHEIINRFLYATVDRVKHGRIDYCDFDVLQSIRDKRSWVLHGLLEAASQIMPKMKELRSVTKKYSVASNFIRYPVYLAIMDVWAAWLCEAIAVEEDGVRLSGDELMNRVVAYQGSQMRVQNEGTNPVLTWFESWWIRSALGTSFEMSYRPVFDDKEKTTTWWLQASQLLDELSILARTLNRKLPWVTPHQLSCRITDAESILREAGWKVDRYRSGGKNFMKIVKHGEMPDSTEASEAYDTYLALQSIDEKRQTGQSKVKGRKKCIKA